VARDTSAPGWADGHWNLVPKAPIRKQRSDGLSGPLPYGVVIAADGSAPRFQPPTGSVALPKHTYRREKREKELKRQRKREEKQQRKLDRDAARTENPDAAEPAAPGASPSE
jgi:hypothetical protein